MGRIRGHIGSEMQLHRSWGMTRYGEQNQVPYKGGHQNSEKRFQSDHDLLKDAVQGNPIKASEANYPERIIFGLPHNYFFSSIQAGKEYKKADVHPVHRDDKEGWTAKGRGRRASPLFLHIHRFNNQCAAVQFMLPAIFLPEDDRIELKAKRKQYRQAKTGLDWVDWKKLDDYLDRFRAAKRIFP
ncbi:MAG: hypothetical protein GY862_37760 [Gammaproteobacteria bacterium]|nr:hypothetical protein [Gammaproteobacteria bacterium]